MRECAWQRLLAMSLSDDLYLKLDEIVHEMAGESFKKLTRSVDDSPLGSVDGERGLRRRLALRSHSCLGIKNNRVCLTPQAEVCRDADVSRPLLPNHLRVGDDKGGPRGNVSRQRNHDPEGGAQSHHEPECQRGRCM